MLHRRSLLTGLAATSLISNDAVARLGSHISRGRNLPGPTFFMKAVWTQPSSMFSTWSSRGINVLDLAPEGWDPSAWTKDAASRGLRVIANAPRQHDTRVDNL